MNQPTLSIKPKLRPLDMRPIIHNGSQFILLRDPLGLSENTVLIPQNFAPVLMFLDGSRDSSQIAASLAVRFGISVSLNILDELISVLDDAYLLENEKSFVAQRQKLLEFRQAPYRIPSSINVITNEDVQQLSFAMEQWLEADFLNKKSENNVEGFESKSGLLKNTQNMLGCISPHIDYQRGHKTYAALWNRVAPFLDELEYCILLGTDHYSQSALLTLTEQNYNTPFGIFITDIHLIERMKKVFDEEALFAEELHHVNEHSIELALIWLGFMLNKKKQQKKFNVKTLPILCGDLLRAKTEDWQMIEEFTEIIRDETKGKKTMILAGADLSHVGPAFGGQPIGLVEKAFIKKDDEELISLMLAGKYEDFFYTIKSMQNKNNICGVTPIYLTMRLMQAHNGELLSYELCHADEQNTSWVSICSCLLE